MLSHLILARSYLEDATRAHDMAQEPRRSLTSLVRDLFAKIDERFGLKGAGRTGDRTARPV